MRDRRVCTVGQLVSQLDDGPKPAVEVSGGGEDNNPDPGASSIGRPGPAGSLGRRRA